jgi:hypothetical protein
VKIYLAKQMGIKNQERKTKFLKASPRVAEDEKMGGGRGGDDGYSRPGLSQKNYQN